MTFIYILTSNYCIYILTYTTEEKNAETKEKNST